MSDLQISEYLVPTEVDDAFREVVRVRNAVEADALGSDVLALSAEELLTVYRDNPQWRRRLFSAHLDGELVGRTITMLPRAGSTASIVVHVLPEHRRRGIGAALLEATASTLSGEGRPSVQCHVTHRTDAGGELLVPPTGFGAVPADDPGARFLQRHGYRLEQVARISSLEVAETDVALGELADRWKLHTWTGATPPRWLADLAALKTTMSTADPAGDLVQEVVEWSVDDVTRRDADLAEAGRTLLTAVVEDIGSGRLVALTEIEVPADATRPAVQEDTLVLAEHRGHRLGTVVKAANLRRLRERRPDTTVVTWNAEENRPMLDVNEALGFRAIGFEGSWEKREASAPASG